MAKIKQQPQCLRLSFILVAILAFIMLVPASIAEADDSASGQGSFTVAPAISDIQVSDVTISAATISWKTFDPATSQVFYDIEFHDDIANYAYQTGEDTTLVTEHSVRLTGLSSGTTYHFRVRSVVDGIEAISSDYTFTTRTPAPAPPAPGPEPEPPSYYEKIDFFGETSEWPISSSGRLLETVEITSKDGKINLYIPKGTFCLDKEGNRLRELVIKVDEEAPEPPRDSLILGKAYNLGPDGATFDPYLRLTLTYEEEDIPEGVEEENLYIAYYDSAWVPLDSIVDTGENKVSADITHFTTFAIMARLSPPPSPAKFVVSNLAISPSEVKLGEEVTITIEVTNIGGREGSHLVSLWIDGALEETKEVTLAPKAVKIVVFTVTRDELGTYSVEVDGLTGSFAVKEELVVPAAFTVSDLTISPSEVYIGETVSIRVVVANTGDESSSCRVTLKINGVVEATKEVTLAPGASESITFTTSKDVAGTYLVDVDGLTGSFTVKEKEVPFIKLVNWPLIGGIIGGLTAVGLLVYFLVVRRRRTLGRK